MKNQETVEWNQHGVEEGEAMSHTDAHASPAKRRDSAQRDTNDKPASGKAGERKNSDADRLRPWDQPVYQRQLKLADRLSTPVRCPRSPVFSEDASDDQGDPDPHGCSRSAATRGKKPEGSDRYSLYSTSLARASSRSGSNSAGRKDGHVSPRPTSVVFPWRGRPLHPSAYNSRSATPDELWDIVGRLTKPTVSSRGGVDLEGKQFVYIRAPRVKTLPAIPGLERRYLGLQSVSSEQLDGIVKRLTRMTSAYTAKFAPNKNVWLDMEPGAHLVRQRKQQAAL